MSTPLTVENLANGGVVERIHDAIKQVVSNITDPNTEAKKPRKIKMEMTIKPNEQRNTAEVIVSVSTALQHPRPLESSIMLEYDPRTGELGASELRSGENPAQHSLPDIPENGKITNFNPARSTVN